MREKRERRGREKREEREERERIIVSVRIVWKIRLEVIRLIIWSYLLP